MSDKVRVPFGDSQSDTATLLLAAAEESKDFSVDDVQVSSYGGFLVPEGLAKDADLDYEDEDEAMGHVYNDSQVAEAEKTPLEGPQGDIEPESDKPPAKKTAAKRAPAKKTAAKRAARKGGE